MLTSIIGARKQQIAQHVLLKCKSLEVATSSCILMTIQSKDAGAATSMTQSLKLPRINTTIESSRHVLTRVLTPKNASRMSIYTLTMATEQLTELVRSLLTQN